MAFLFIGATSAIAQDYKFTVESPQEGEQYKIGETVKIVWTTGNPEVLDKYGEGINVEYSVADEKNWINITTTKPYTTSYEWQLTEDLQLKTGKYWIRISETQNNPEHKPFHFAGNSGYFEIIAEEPCPTPAILSEPQSQRACTGSTIVLNAKIDALPGSIYTWFKDGEQYTKGSDESALVLSDITSDAAGIYYVTVLNECGESATSKSAVITVGNTVQLVTNPEPAFQVCETDMIVMNAYGTGDDVTYQWRKDGVAIDGATSFSYSIDPVRPVHAGVYDVIISGSCGNSIVSTRSIVGVYAQPVILTKPLPMTVCTGQPLTLEVTASGAGLVYQWYKNDEQIVGATDSKYVIQNTQLADEGYYHAVVKTGPNSPEMCARTISVDPVPVSVFKAPVITSQPSAAIGCVGGSATMVVEVEGSGLVYQWFRNGQAIQNANAPALVVTNITAADAGGYNVSVTGTCGLTLRSQNATLTVTTAPRLVASPSAQTVMMGETVTLNAEVDVQAPVQWYRNTVAVPGATTATYAINNAQPSASGVYYAVFQGPCGGIVTGSARVLVTDPSANVPEVTLSATSVDFGEIPTGYSADRTIDGIITNTGKAPLEIQSLAIASAAYEVVDGPTLPLTLAPGAATTLKIKATAGAVGEFASKLVITSNAPVSTDEIDLVAMSVLRYSHPANVQFATTELSKSAEQCFDVTNISTQEIALDNVTAGGINPAVFEVITPMPLTLAAGATANVCVRFTPTELGAASANIMITSSTGGNSNLAATGEGSPTVGVTDDVRESITVFPNPSMGNVTIRTNGVEILNARVISSIGTTVATVDAHELVWNGRDASGAPVASGIYTIVVTTPAGIVTLPVVVNR